MRCITWRSTLYGCLAAKFDLCNNLLSSVHAISVIKLHQFEFWSRKFIIIIMVLWKVFAVTAVHFSIAAVHFAITAVRFAKAAVHFVITAVHLAITAVHFAITAGNLAVTAVHFVITAVHFVITAVHLFQAVYLCWTGRQLVMRMMNTRQRRRRTTTLLTAARKELLTSRLCSWEARSRSIRYWASLTHTQP